MDRLNDLLTIMDNALNTRRKRHLAGGILMSVSLLFGGIAVTIFTIKSVEDNLLIERELEV